MISRNRIKNLLSSAHFAIKLGNDIHDCNDLILGFAQESGLEVKDWNGSEFEVLSISRKGEVKLTQWTYDLNGCGEHEMIVTGHFEEYEKDYAVFIPTHYEEIL